MSITNHNQLNHNEITDQENNINTTEQNTQHLSRLQNEIGSKVLTLVNFESKHKDIVESSFNKARNKKEKLPGKNNERRNFAYLSRLDRMVEKYGNKAEQKLWAASAENLVMNYEDIPEAYWKQQEQILRDNGQGRELSRREKEILAEDLIDKQRQSITSWANYLSDKNCPYPLWFKVYAFDGISKMSNALNLDDADYNRRDNTTALSFPKLNAEILAKVYRQINDFYGVDKENWLAQHSDDEKLVSLVKSANFPKLYAKELVDTKVIIKTPERTEDVHGDWFEYKLGDEEEIASLAEGTRWCVVDPNVAHNYLVYGEYGHSISTGSDKESNSKAKFIIFRLEDPNSHGVYASNGSASIRLDPNGIVDEVSGLNDGQAVEDALVPIVKEKALSLPGGEKYLQKFDDKQALIRLDKKMEKGEDLTKEELSFLYGLDRPIATLDTYNREDPRIPELKEKYSIEYALEKGVDVNRLISVLESYEIVRNLDTFLEHGADIDNIVKNMDSFYIARNLDAIIDHGAYIDDIVNNMDSYYITEYINSLLKHGADVDNIVNNMEYSEVADKLDILIEHGADIDVNKLASSLYPGDVAHSLDTLLKYGADIDVNELVSNLSPDDISESLGPLLKNGANINVNELVSSLDPRNISLRLNNLLKYGADINNILSNMEPRDISDSLDTLLKYGANINVNELASNLDSGYIAYNLEYLLEHGASVNNLVNNMNSYYITEVLDTLIEHGADVNNIVSNIHSSDIAYDLDTLLKYGADVNNIIKKMDKEDIEDNIDLLREYGANL